LAPQAGDECIVIFANDSWYRVIRSNDPNLEKIKHPRHDLNHGIALVGMALNPARPDRERTMREAPSPKEGVLEISNGEASLSLNESGEIVLKNGKGSITLTAEGQISLKREGQPESRTRSSSKGIEIMDTMSQLVAATQNLTTTGSSTAQATSPASKAELDRIQTHFNYVLVKDDEGNETDSENIGNIDKVLIQEKLIHQNEKNDKGNYILKDIVRKFGCNMRILQAIGEIELGKALTAKQIEDIYDKGCVLGKINKNNCGVLDNNWVIKETMRTLFEIPEDAEKVIANMKCPAVLGNHPSVEYEKDGYDTELPTNINHYSSRFVRREHKTNAVSLGGRHYVLTYRDRKNSKEIFTWDPYINYDDVNFVIIEDIRFRFFDY